MAEPRYVINFAEGEPMPPVEDGTGPVPAQVLEVLWTARSQEGRKNSRRAVIDGMAPGVGADELEVICEAAIELQARPL